MRHPFEHRAIEKLQDYEQDTLRIGRKLNIDQVQQIFYDHWSAHMSDNHSLTTDATCYESHLRYPTNVKLLWECVDWLYGKMKSISGELGEPLPRIRYLKWKKRYVSYSKMRSKTKKKRKVITRSLLLLLTKLSGEMNRLETGITDQLTPHHHKRRATAKKTFQQQNTYFHKGKKPRERIVSLDRPYIRPIVRGKEIKPVEFGAKINKFQIDGISFIEHLTLTPSMKAIGN